MAITLYFLPVVVPVLFWSGYHYYKDRHLPEPVGHLVLTFALGVGSAWISKSLYVGLGWVELRYDALDLAMHNVPGLLAYSVLAIGPIEELAKMLPFLLVVLRFDEFDEPVDGIIYASFIALGYAAVENVHYLQYLTTGEAIARGFAAPIVHILFASIWGYFIGRAYLRQNRVLFTIAVAFAGTALLHGLYDFLVLAYPSAALPLAALMILGVWIWRILLIRRLSRG